MPIADDLPGCRSAPVLVQQPPGDGRHRRLTGRPAVTLTEFVEQNRQIFMPENRCLKKRCGTRHLARLH
jgi:hypothetical protein